MNQTQKAFTEHAITAERPLAVDGILFDLDGTLIDSAPDLGGAANAMLTELGLPLVDGIKIAGWIGNGIPKLVKRALTGDLDGEPDAGLFEQALELFMRTYQANVCVKSQLYPGVLDGLKSFKQRGFTLGVVTNKAERCTLPLLEQIGIADYFTAVVSGDSCANKKPHPEPVYRLIELMQLRASDCVLIGDSVHDLHAAENAQIPALAVNWGYAQGADLGAMSPHPLISDFSQLAALFSRKTSS